MESTSSGPPGFSLDPDAREAEVEVLGERFSAQFLDGGWRIPSMAEDEFSAHDTETTLIVYDGTPLEGVTLQVCYLRSRLVHVVPWYAWDAYFDDYCRARPGDELVMHNAAFDLKVLRFTERPWLWQAFWDSRVTDTMVRTLHHSQASGRYMPQLSLKVVARAVLRVDVAKDADIRLGHTRHMRYTRDHLVYGAKDSIVTAMVRRALGGPVACNAAGSELLALKGAIALEAVRDNGMLVDAAEYTRMRRTLAENVEHHADFLREWGVQPGEEGNSLALQRVLGKLEERYGFKLPVTDKSGARQLTDLSMSRLEPEQRHPFMASYVCYIGARQILSHFFHDDLEAQGLEGGDDERRVHPDGRIHPRYAWATDTGRTQCSKPNAQNFPRAAELWWDALKDKPDVRLSVRGYIVPSPGMCFNSVDYNQLELCTLAEDCMVRFGESKMAELINDGVDLHTWFGEQVSLARAQDWRKFDKKTKKLYRQMAKSANWPRRRQGLRGSDAAAECSLIAGTPLEPWIRESVKIPEDWATLAAKPRAGAERPETIPAGSRRQAPPKQERAHAVQDIVHPRWKQRV